MTPELAQLLREARDELLSLWGAVDQEYGSRTDGPEPGFEELIARIDRVLGEEPQHPGWTGGYHWRLDNGWTEVRRPDNSGVYDLIPPASEPW